MFKVNGVKQGTNFLIRESRKEIKLTNNQIVTETVRSRSIKTVKII